MNKANDSFLQATWRRFRKNTGAMAGLCLIGLALLLCIFGYLLAPDGSPNANRMILETGSAKPGTTFHFILVKKEPQPALPNLLVRLAGGRTDAFLYIPVSSYRVSGDSLFAQHYIDEGVAEPIAYRLEQLAESPVESRTYWLGSDKFGRDILSRLIIGTRVSLGVGLVTVIISLLAGVSLGAVSGYFGGRTDAAIQWLVNVVWSIPTLLLVFAITLLLGKGFWQVFVAIGLTMWVNVARLVRGQVLAVKELQYVEAARVLGVSNTRIITRHILPNMLGPILVIAASIFAAAIVIEAGLSFLGIGVLPPTPSWGLMIREHYNFIITQNPALALVPGIAIMLLVLAFNLVGNGLRDATDVKS
ncbi:peptide/nickel transport system permease protein [Cnuella takakiae]|uniref:Peptide/nickel transport system permease protein n=1 Tax=Cnuella takakiae TaxID=1302690 RepID=A0A1M5CZP6_9BACT|nr:ABC transporter permease [Cnuella takakiae]OLY94151.1 peptide transporter [Cnuella takakiae]SHF60293.1 peptide/nickel transport system permease protein [Cnuella takakiae]